MKKVLIHICFLLITCSGLIAGGEETPGRPIRDVQQIILDHYVHFAEERVVFVDVNHQRMYVLSKNQILQDFQISTSKYGEGEVANSNKTPLGLHFVAKK